MSLSTTTTTKRERLEAREQDILKAARRVFLQHGYQGAKMSLIAREAGVADGTLYLYYKSKNAIADAVLDVHWRSLTDGARNVIANFDDSIEKLQAFTAYHIEKLVHEWRIIELGYVQHYTGTPSIDKTVAFMRDYAELLDDILLQGIDRGTFRSDLDIFFYRDLFFGTQEYAARSLLFRKTPEGIQSIVSNLMTVLIASAVETKKIKSADQPMYELKDLTERLAAVTVKLESIAK